MLLQSRAALVAASKKDFIPTRFMARWQGEAGWQPEPNHDVQRSKPLEAAASRCSSNLTMAAFVTQPDTDDSKKFSHHTKVNSMVKTMFHLYTRHAVIDQVPVNCDQKKTWAIFRYTRALKKRELAMNIVVKFKPLSSKGELTTPSLSFMQVAGPNRCFGSCTMSFLPRLREFPIKREAWDQNQTCFKQGRVQPVEKRPHWNLSLERVRKWVVHDELTNCPL